MKVKFIKWFSETGSIAGLVRAMLGIVVGVVCSITVLYIRREAKRLQKEDPLQNYKVQTSRSGDYSILDYYTGDAVGGVGVGNSYVEFATLRNHVIIVVWTDITWSAWHGGGVRPKEDCTHWTSTLSCDDGLNFEWEVESQDGLSGPVVINGREYDLSHGGVFVVETKREELAITQLKVDLSTVEASSIGLARLAEGNEIISEFLKRIESNTPAYEEW